METQKLQAQTDKTWGDMEKALDMAMADIDPMESAKEWHDTYNRIVAPFNKELGKLSREKRLGLKCVLGDPVSDSGKLMTVEDFVECVVSGGFIDYDGSGTYVKDGRLTNITINPSDVRHDAIRKEFTEIVWFNR